MNYTDVAGMQLIRSAGTIERYLKQAVGRSFKLQKPLLAVDPKTVRAKFVMRKGGEIDGISYWPMFVFYLIYDPGFDEYRVKTEYWDDMKLGKPLYTWESGGTMPLENVFDPKIVFRTIAPKAKKRLESKRTTAGTKAVNTSNLRPKKDPADKKYIADVEVRFPVNRYDRRSGAVKLTYTSYTGKEYNMKLSPNTARTVARSFALIGKRGATYMFDIYHNGSYRLLPVGSAARKAQTGRMTDRYAPEIIVK